jgi:hypothetical protein
MNRHQQYQHVHAKTMLSRGSLVEHQAVEEGGNKVLE